jgi:outer membrane lipoprotein carrier protein
MSSAFHDAMARHPDEEKAFKILDQISQHNFQATFTYHSRSPQHEQSETLEGKIAVQGHRYRLSIQDQEIINNGQTVWTYLKDANEVQITEQDPEQNTATPWTIFANYRQSYTLNSLDTHQDNGHVYDIIKLIAKDIEQPLSKVTLTIEHTTKYINRVEILDSNQTLYTFSITDFEYDLKFDTTFFNFNIKEHRGIEIIDMR